MPARPADLSTVAQPPRCRLTLAAPLAGGAEDLFPVQDPLVGLLIQRGRRLDVAVSEPAWAR